MKRICISSSLRFKDVVRDTIDRFRSIGIDALFPNLNSGLNKDEIDEPTFKRLVDEHFQAIDISEALYVINPGGYIGDSVKVEIEHARGGGVPVYFSEKTNSTDLDLLSKDTIPLDSIVKFYYLPKEL